MLTRQKEFFQWIISGVFTALVIVGTVYVSNHHTEILAALTGPQTDKSKTLDQRLPASQPANKGGGQMTVALSSPNSSTASSTEPLVIKATVDAMADLADVRFEWILPEGLTPVKGTVTGEIGALSEGATGDVEISLLIPQGSENKQIHLQVYRLIDGERMGQVAQYNTVELKDVEITAGLKRAESEDPRSPAAEKPRMMQ